MRNTVTCPGCRAQFPDFDGPTPANQSTSSGCWARFGQALAVQYSDHRFWPAHQLLMDAYGLQHSRGDDARALRLACVHLGALYAQVHLGQTEARVIALRRALAQRPTGAWNAAWPAPSATIADVEISGPSAHLRSVEDYARAVLSDWSAHHAVAERLCRI